MGSIKAVDLPLVGGHRKRVVAPASTASANAHVAIFTTTADRHVFVIYRTSMACRRHDEDIDRKSGAPAPQKVRMGGGNDPDVNIFYEMLQSIAMGVSNNVTRLARLMLC